MEQKAEESISKDVLTEELRFILRDLRQKAQAGTRARLSEARNEFEESLTLEFSEYFRFLRRYKYLVINRSDQTLIVTDKGRDLVEKGTDDIFSEELSEHFEGRIEAPKPFMEEDTDGSLGDSEVFLSNLKEESVPDLPSQFVEKKVDSILLGADTPSAISKKPLGAAAVPKGAKVDSKYARHDVIGSGGIGTVYRGRHHTLALEIAIKEIRDLFAYFNFLQRSEVIRQLKMVVGQMASISHPLIVKILDENTEVAHPYFVMEYLPGGNLRQRLDHGPLSVDFALILFCQLCYAMRAAHENDVVHGNLKPENILLDARDNIRITDFGMMRLLQCESDRAAPQIITGSVAYLSPEQMKQRSDIQATSDIYSLGILFYEMVTGNIPGRRSPLPSRVNQQLPKQMDDLFDRLTKDEPKQRISSMDSVLEEFYRHFPDGRYLSKDKLILFERKFTEDPVDAKTGFPPMEKPT